MSITQVHSVCQRIRAELAQRVIGQNDVIDELLVAVLAGGHALLVGVPGVAKTLLVRSLAEALGLTFNRVQFTPDLMPADITGTEMLHVDPATGARSLQFLPGPIFANVVLADEINRTPPKTQAALLEAMQEQQVTMGGQRHLLPHPFFVLATQNPIEQEGTYPLPEAQSDRFMMEIHVDYPNAVDELEIARRARPQPTGGITTVVSEAELVELQRVVDAVPMSEHDLQYALALVRCTRVKGDAVPDFVKKYLRWGAGPRATQYLVLAAKAHAALHNRPAATWHDVRAVLKPVLRHRLVTTFNAESDNLTADDLIDKVLAHVPSPEQHDRAGIAGFFQKKP